jgi:hypothetical protein
VRSFWYVLTSLGGMCDKISVVSQSVFCNSKISDRNWLRSASAPQFHAIHLLWVSEGQERGMKFEYESETSAEWGSQARTQIGK